MPRRKIRFTVRALLLLIVVISLLLAQLVIPSRRQIAVRDRIYQLNGRSVVGAGVSAPRWLGPFGPAGVVAVDLSNTAATGDDIRHLVALRTLSSLDLAGTVTTDDDVAVLLRFPELRHLNLSATRISDHGCALLARASGLESLELRDCAIGDQGLLQLSSLSKLKSLDLRSTKITSQGLTQVRAFPALKSLSVDDRSLTVECVSQLAAISGLALQVSITEPTVRRLRDMLQTANVSSCATLGPSEAEVWSVLTAWEDTTGGVAELVSREADLDEADAFALLGVLAVNKPDRGWVKRTERGQQANVRPRPTLQDLHTFEEFVRALKDRDQSVDVDAYARQLERGDIPRLIEALGHPDIYRTNHTACWHYSSLLVRLGANDEVAIEQLQRLLDDEDAHVRTITSYSLSEFWQRRMRHVPDWRLSDERPDIVHCMLTRLKDDPHWEVQSNVARTIADSLGTESEVVLPILVQLVSDPKLHVRHPATYALERVAQSSPAIRRAAVRALGEAAMKQTGEVHKSIMTALRAVVRTDEQLSLEAAQTALGEFADGILGASFQEASADIVNASAWPAVVKAVVPELLQFSKSQDLAVRDAASQTLAGVAVAVRNREPPSEEQSTR